jgi:tRNA (guanosine-2'-O-)-methyltransferase
MYGFTESFNISVSVALCLYDLTQKIRSTGIDWQLTDDQHLDLKLTWLRRLIRGSAGIEKKFLENR